MSTTDNPAGRLLAVLNKIRKANIKQDAPAWQAWAQVLKSQPESSEVLEQLLDLNRALDRAVKEVAALGRETEEYKQNISRVRQALSPVRFNGHWKHVVDRLDDGALMALSSYSEILSLTRPDGEVPDDKLSELQIAINELIERIMNLESHDEFTQFALEQLEKIRSALLQYRIRGPEGLKTALESVAGALVGSRQLMSMGEETRPELHKQFGEIVTLLNQTVQVVERFSPYAASLAEGLFLKMLESGNA